MTTRRISGTLLGTMMMLSVPACFGDSIILFNGSFDSGSSGVVSHAGAFGGPSAADGWNIWNNDSGATTTTELCSATSCGGRTPYGEAPGTLPPTPIDGAYTLHVVTTAVEHNNGLYTTFAPVNAITLDTLWVYVVTGTVAQGVGNGGDTPIDKPHQSVGTGYWQELTSYSPAGVANEMIIYATEDGTPADFYVDAASVTAYSAAPEPASLALLFGAALCAGVARYRAKSVV